MKIDQWEWVLKSSSVRILGIQKKLNRLSWKGFILDIKIISMSQILQIIRARPLKLNQSILDEPRWFVTFLTGLLFWYVRKTFSAPSKKLFEIPKILTETESLKISSSYDFLQIFNNYFELNTVKFIAGTLKAKMCRLSPAIGGIVKVMEAT